MAEIMLICFLAVVLNVKIEYSLIGKHCNFPDNSKRILM